MAHTNWKDTYRLIRVEREIFIFQPIHSAFDWSSYTICIYLCVSCVKEKKPKVRPKNEIVNMFTKIGKKYNKIDRHITDIYICVCGEIHKWINLLLGMTSSTIPFTLQ